MCLLTRVVAVPVCGAKRFAMRGSSSGAGVAGTRARDVDDDGSVSSKARPVAIAVARAEKPTPFRRLRERWRRAAGIWDSVPSSSPRSLLLLAAAFAAKPSRPDVFGAAELGVSESAVLRVVAVVVSGDAARWRRPALRFLFARKRTGAGSGVGTSSLGDAIIWCAMRR